MKPKAISKRMTFENYLEVKVKGRGHFKSLIGLKIMLRVTELHPTKTTFIQPVQV